MSEDSSDLHFLCVRDGTIFTLLKQPTPHQPEPGIQQMNSSEANERKSSFGFLGLAIFEHDQWKRIKTQNVVALLWKSPDSVQIILFLCVFF